MLRAVAPCARVAGWNVSLAQYSIEYVAGAGGGRGGEAGLAEAERLSHSRDKLLAMSKGEVAIGGILGKYAFDGYIDECRLWDVDRTEEQIRENMNRPMALNTPNLLGQWTFNEGAGEIVVAGAFVALLLLFTVLDDATLRTNYNMEALLVVFTSMGALAGYVSAVMYKGFKGTEWRMTTLKTALMFPGIIAAVFFDRAAGRRGELHLDRLAAHGQRDSRSAAHDPHRRGATAAPVGGQQAA